MERLEARGGAGHYAFLTLKLPGGEVTVEDFMEEMRPATRPSRKKAWFMCTEPSATYHASPGSQYVDVHLAELVPERVSRHHFGWMGRINDAAFVGLEVTEEQEELLRGMAQMYWKGLECPEYLMGGAKYDWEWLSEVVTVRWSSHRMKKGFVQLVDPAQIHS